MSIPVYLVGSNGQRVAVNDTGELLIAPGDYDLAVFKELAEPDTAYNFFKPDNNKKFVLTGFLAYADKQVSTVNNATVIIYEADAPDSTTVDKALVQFELGQNQSVPFPSLRILGNIGVYVNAKTDDDDIHMTIFGHFINT